MKADKKFKCICVVFEAIFGTIIAMLITSIIVNKVNNLSGALCNMLLDITILSIQLIILCINYRGNILKRAGFVLHGMTLKRFVEAVVMAFIVVVLSFLILYTLKAFRFEGIEAAYTYVIVLFAQMLLVGIAEEVVFRGVIQSHLAQVFDGRKALVMATLVFTIFHCTVIYSITQVTDILVLGFMLGLIYLKTGSIVYSIGFHFGIDFATNLTGLKDSGALFLISTDHSDNYLSTLLFGAMTVTVLLILVVYLVKNHKRQAN